MVILELIHAPIPDSVEGLCLLVTEPTQALPGLAVIHNNRTNRMASAGVDPSSSHMLVSKVKPCMSQYKLLYVETANASFKQL